jgi:TonB family protein
LKRAAILITVFCTFALAAQAQRLAELQHTKDGEIAEFANALRTDLAKHAKLIDDDLAASAYRSVEIADPFNMSADEARRVGSVIGCDRFLIFRSTLQRRAATGGRYYFEAYAVTYLVDSRTGLLIKWDLNSTEASDAKLAVDQLIKMIPSLAAGIANAKLSPSPPTNFPEPPSENSPESVGLKLPLPYKRIRPEYTTTAALYSVKATVDIEVDIEAEGRIAATRIVRWAGFGLDEAVERAVRSMNWRPAMRNGKSLPMRVLLRYNFRKVEG